MRSIVTAISTFTIVQVKPFYVLIVGCAAWATAPLVLGFMLDIVRGPRCRYRLHGWGGLRRGSGG